MSATGSNLEHCEVTDPAAGTWWVLIQNWDGTDAQPDDYLLSTAAWPAMQATPTWSVRQGRSHRAALRRAPDVGPPPSAPGDIWYGTAILGSSPSSPGDIGSFPVTIHRDADDVTKTASVTQAVAGDSINYAITVQPNVTDTTSSTQSSTPSRQA